MTNLIDQINIEIVEQQKLVDKRDRLLKLKTNRDFDMIFMKGFLEKDCAMYAKQSVDYSIPDTDRYHALELAQAAGHLQAYLNATIVMGNMAEETIKTLRAEIDAQFAED